MVVPGQLYCNCCKMRDIKLFDCARCEAISYCGRGCQRGDWESHKQECVQKIVGPKRELGLFIDSDQSQISTMSNNSEHFAKLEETREKEEGTDVKGTKASIGKLNTLPPWYLDGYNELENSLGIEQFGGSEQFDFSDSESKKQVASLRFKKLRQYVNIFGISSTDFDSALRGYVEDKTRGNTSMDIKAEMLWVCESIGLAQEEAAKAVDVVGRWKWLRKSDVDRKIPSQYLDKLYETIAESGSVTKREFYHAAKKVVLKTLVVDGTIRKSASDEVSDMMEVGELLGLSKEQSLTAVGVTIEGNDRFSYCEGRIARLVQCIGQDRSANFGSLAGADEADHSA
jgi:hypothetical protein